MHVDGRRARAPIRDILAWISLVEEKPSVSSSELGIATLVTVHPKKVSISRKIKEYQQQPTPVGAMTQSKNDIILGLLIYLYHVP